ncbi:TPA: fimbrial protein [Salmonella enterica subsp. enterica serovar Hvittingfoss]|nr:fimbrial protein [Salmonella enterica subsp. enterica serovar Hvittingfoss]
MATGTEVFRSPAYTVSYTCTTELNSNIRFATTLYGGDSFGTLIERLKKAGLGMNISIHETGMTVSDIQWWQITNTMSTGGGVEFGAPINSNTSDISRSATVQLSLYVEQPVDTAQIVQVPSSTFRINPCSPSSGCKLQSSAALTNSSFAIRYMPDNFGYVSVTPSSINIGHIYTDYPATSTKTASFTVEAGQRAGGWGGGTFTIPLQVTFTAPGNELTDASRAVVMTSNGISNGLKLSLLDNITSTKVTFNQPSDLGTLQSDKQGDMTAPVRKTYTAQLSPIPGQTLNTGPFSADVVVTVTYN